VQTVVGCQVGHDLGELVRKALRLLEAARGIRRGDRREVEVVNQVGIAQLVTQAEPARLELVGALEVAVAERVHAACVARCRLQAGLAELLCELECQSGCFVAVG